MAVPPPRQLPDALTCQGPDEAPPENEVLLRCAVKAGIKVSKVSLHYRPAGSETFTEITMPRNKKGWYTGVLPASATEGKSLQYFVEGAGPNKISSGTSESPNLILVREGARPAGPDDPLPDGSEEEDEDEDERPSSVNEDPLAAVAMQRAIERDRVGAHRREAGQMFVALGLGTGFGWQPGGVLEFRKDREVAAGPLSGGLGHVLPEFGYQLNEDFALSLQGRVQFIPTQGSGDATVGTPAERAIAVLVRAVYAFGSGNLRGFASVAAGAGEGFRLKVPPDPAVRLVRSDTVKGGPLVGGVGLGFAYHFNRHVAWSTEARALVGAPTIAAIGEISSGLELGF